MGRFHALKAVDFQNESDKLKAKRREYDKTEGARLKKLRLRKGLKGYWVAEQIRIQPTNLSDLEAGRRHWNPELVAAYEKAIGV